MSSPSPCPKVSYSIREACAATSLGRTTVYAHIAAGRLQAVHVGGRTVIPAESLLSLIGSRPASAPPNSSLQEREDK